ncbi:multiple sugar transport system substrate-binding protein [Thermocatellispora tengchongensis]|uniref:Multiple sugar transport system substrate-binding protein n=1 Tax=Thermocatellispora tengchongensis TaxID=1073253 RepID=A0A840PSC4_9ACTN|nr:sugar ABC transporter substrate-binding protein [Thermocatellispora tengchongensis]MBB5140027.1 multiple sugar transport system substrate-binding protein [Thermocatellispora tengchongensis]
MRKHRRRTALTAAALLAGVVTALSACGSSGGSAPGTPGASGPATGTLRFVGPEEPKTFEPVIAGFEAENPGIQVEYTQVPFDQLNNVLQQRLAAKDSSIDVYTVDQPRLSALAARGFLVDLSDLREKVRQAVVPGQYEVNVFRDKMWAVPIWTSDQFLFYNAALLKKAGVTPPSRDPAQRWTWEQVAEAGKKAQEKAGAQWAVIPEQIEQFYQLQSLAESAGGGPGITGPDMLTPAITTDGWIKAMTWYHDLFANKLAPRGVGSFQTSPLFSEGKVAFFVGGPWDVGVFGAVKDLDWGIAPHPYFAGGKQVTPTGSWSWGINPASTQQAMARKFLEYASLDPEGNLLTTKNTTIIPSNKAAFDTYLPTLDALAGDKSKGVGEILTYDAGNTAVARPTSVGYIQFEEIMTKAFADIRNGADPRARLEKATGEIKTAWAQLR